MKMVNNKTKGFIFFVLSSVAFLAGILVSLFYFVAPQIPRPYIADHVSLILGRDKNTLDPRPLLYELQILNGRGLKTALITEAGNPEAYFSNPEHFADDISASIFQGDSLNNSFINKYGLAAPFEIKRHIDSNSAVQLRYLNGGLSLIAEGDEIVINGSPVKLSDVEIYRLNAIDKNNLVRIGRVTIDLRSYQNDLDILLSDFIDNKIEVYEQTKENVLSAYNYSFEQGIWPKALSDCSAYLPGEALIGSSLVANSTNGQFGISLRSDNHHACLIEDFGVSLSQDSIYRLAIDYQNLAGGVIRYYFSLRQEDNLIADKFRTLEVKDYNWHTAEEIIDSKEDASVFSVYLYAPSDGSFPVVNNFDNIRLEEFSLKNSYSLAAGVITQNIALNNWVSLADGPINLSYQRPAENLLADFNYSFEPGPWLDQAVDCSNYLEGKPEFYLASSDISTDGGKSMLVSSKNHSACVFTTFPVDLEINKIYRLYFDYQSLSGGKVQYYFNFKNQFGGLQENYGLIDVLDHHWHTEEKLINPALPQAQNLDLYFYAPSAGDKEVSNLYDNIRLFEVAPKSLYDYYLFIKTFKEKPDSKITDFFQTKAGSRFNLSASRPTVLVLPTDFDQDIKLFVNGIKLDDSFHYLLNGNENGWLINQSLDNAEINIRLKSSIAFYLKILILFAIFSACLYCYYAYRFKK